MDKKDRDPAARRRWPRWVAGALGVVVLLGTLRAAMAAHYAATCAHAARQIAA